MELLANNKILYIKLILLVLSVEGTLSQLVINSMTTPASRNVSQDVSLHPSSHEIVMVGHQSVIKIICEVKRNIRLVPYLIQPLAKVFPSEIICLTGRNNGKDGLNNTTTEVDPSTPHELELTGLAPGRTTLMIAASDVHDNTTILDVVTDSYVVTVVRRVDVARDAFMYVVAMVKFCTLLMLGFRMRSEAVKEVLLRPCALINAILCQVALLPLVTLGVALALSLPVHSVICLLVIGCCPTGVLSPIFCVLQQSHVELAILLAFIETLAAFGAVPGWLFAYGHFLGVAYSQVSFPYLHIAGALGYVAFPILLGMALKKCVKGPLRQFDKSIQPVCLLVAMIAVAVSICNLLHLWVHVTWRLLVSCALFPVAGLLVGLIVNAIFRQKLPQLKTVGVVTCIQNTLLAKVILQTSYPAADVSFMAVTIACVEALTLALMLVCYILHVISWLASAHYRIQHDSVGISGFQCSIGERLVQNMVKAGEIRFCNRGRSVSSQSNMAPESHNGSACCSAESIDTTESKVSKISERNILNNRASSFTQKTLGSVNKAFSSSFDSLGRTSQVVSTGPTGTDLTLNYFVTPDGSPSNGKNNETKELNNKDKDTLSIDYDMLTITRDKDKAVNLSTKNISEGENPDPSSHVTDAETTSQAPSLCADNIGLIENNYK